MKITHIRIKILITQKWNILNTTTTGCLRGYNRYRVFCEKSTLYMYNNIYIIYKTLLFNDKPLTNQVCFR